MRRLTLNKDGLPVIGPLETHDDVIALINNIKRRNGYRESRADLWLESDLDDIADWIRRTTSDAVREIVAANTHEDCTCMSCMTGEEAGQ